MAEDFVERARALQPLVREHADLAERERRLPAEVARALVGAGLHRIAAAREHGGGEADPMTQIATIEAISSADGSAGWNLMIGIESFGLMAPVFFASTELLRDPTVIASSATSAIGRAVAVDGGFRVSGRWPFVSGCHNAGVFAGLCALEEGGAPIPGRPPSFAIVSSEQLRIKDTWNVGGLRGSGSHDVVVEDVFIPERQLGGALGGDGGTRSATASDWPLLRFPLGSRLAYNKVGVALGIARTAIDRFVELASGKVPRFSGGKLRERAHAQRAAASAELRWRSARALVFDEVASMWERVVERGEVSLRDRALLQMACSDAAQAAAEAVDLVAGAAGTTANELAFPLERLQRDVRVVRMHFTVAPHHIDDAGRVLLGLPPQEPMLAALG